MPSATISIYDHSDTAEGGSPGAVYLARSGDTSQEITVDYLVSGTADNGTDYTTLSGSITFGYYQVYKTIPIPPIDDSLSEPTETVVVTLLIGTNYGIGSVGEATVNIFDNDVPVVSVARENDAAEGGTDGKFAVSRTGDLTNSLGVNFSMSGSALNGTDYVSVGGSVTIPAGQSSAPVLIDPIHDGLVESDETAILTITSGSGYTINPQGGSASLILIDTDISPAAMPCWVMTSVDEPVSLSVVDLAYDPNDDTMSLISVSQGDNGTVTFDQAGSVTFTPDTEFSGDDSYTYTVEDQFGNEATGAVTVTVLEIMAPPTSVWTAEEDPVSIAVLDMAFDPDGDPLTVTGVTQGSNGSVVINQDGSVTYTPNTSFFGDDSFTYTVEDPDENEATQTIIVTVGPTPPIALDDEATTEVDTAVTVTVLDGAYDPEGDTLTVTGVTQGAHGTVVLNQDGTVAYTPASGYEGADTFTYTVSDDDSNLSTGTVNVTVGTPANTPATTILDFLSGIENELDNYEEGSLDTIQDLMPDLLTESSSYLDDSTTLISTNKIDVAGATRPFIDFVAALTATLKLKAEYARLNSLEALTWDTLVALTTRLKTIEQQLKTEMQRPAPNALVIAALKYQYVTLSGTHTWLVDLWGGLAKNAIKNFFAYREAREALAEAYPQLTAQVIALLPNLPLPGGALRNPADITP